MVMITWQLDLQLLMQSVLIITKVVSSNTADGEVYLLQLYVIAFVSDFVFLLVLLQRPPSIKLITKI